jgi:hypothetical protein
MMVTMLTRVANSANHQYSERRARPLKTAYFPRTLLTASPNPIDHSL